MLREMRIKLFKGNAIVNGRQSPYTLYDEKLATYTKEDAFNQESAVGFIDIYGLPTQVNALLHGGIVMSNKAWGGRFETQPEEWVDDFNASIDFDKNLIKQDVQGSIAHATMLAKQHIITDDEAQSIINELKIFKVTLKKVNLNLKLLSKIFILILSTSLFNVLAKLVENCILVVAVMIKLPQICICILKNKFNTLLNL